MFSDEELFLIQVVLDCTRIETKEADLKEKCTLLKAKIEGIRYQKARRASNSKYVREIVDTGEVASE